MLKGRVGTYMCGPNFIRMPSRCTRGIWRTGHLHVTVFCSWVHVLTSAVSKASTNSLCQSRGCCRRAVRWGRCRFHIGALRYPFRSWPLKEYSAIFSDKQPLKVSPMIVICIWQPVPVCSSPLCTADSGQAKAKQSHHEVPVRGKYRKKEGYEMEKKKQQN